MKDSEVKKVRVYRHGPKQSGSSKNVKRKGKTKMKDSEVKKVYAYRHGPKQSGSSKNVIGLSMSLSEEGRKVVKKLADQFLAKNGEVEMIVTSPCVRTYETGMIFAEVCSTFLPVMDRLLLGRYHEWERLIDLVSKKPTALDFYLADPSFILREATNVLKAIRDVARRLELNKNAICVSHGGLIEPTVALAKAGDTTDLSKTFPEDLREGEAVIFVFDEKNDFVEVQKS